MAWKQWETASERVILDISTRGQGLYIDACCGHWYVSENQIEVGRWRKLEVECR